MASPVTEPGLIVRIFIRASNISTHLRSSAAWYGEKEEVPDPITGVTDRQRATTMNLVLSMQTLDQLIAALGTFTEIYSFRVARQLNISTILVALVSVIVEPSLYFLAQMSLKPVYYLYNWALLKKTGAKFDYETDGTVFTRIQNVLILGTSLGLLIFVSPLIIILSLNVKKTEGGETVYENLADGVLRFLFYGLVISRLLVIEYFNQMADMFLELGNVRYGKTLKGLAISSPFAIKWSAIKFFFRKYILRTNPRPRRPVVATDLSFSYARQIPDIFSFFLVMIFFVVMDSQFPRATGFLLLGSSIFIAIGICFVLAEEKTLFSGYLHEDEAEMSDAFGASFSSESEKSEAGPANSEPFGNDLPSLSVDLNLGTIPSDTDSTTTPLAKRLRLQGFEFTFILYFVFSYFALIMSRRQVWPIVTSRLDALPSTLYYILGIGIPLLLSTSVYIGYLLDGFTPENTEKKAEKDAETGKGPRSWFVAFLFHLISPLVVGLFFVLLGLILFTFLDITKEDIGTHSGFATAFVTFLAIHGSSLLVRARSLGFLISYKSVRAQRIAFFSFMWQAVLGIVLGLPAFLIVFFRVQAELKRTGSPEVSDLFDQQSAVIPLGFAAGYLFLVISFFTGVDPFIGKFSSSRYLGKYLLKNRD